MSKHHPLLWLKARLRTLLTGTSIMSKHILLLLKGVLIGVASLGVPGLSASTIASTAANSFFIVTTSCFLIHNVFPIFRIGRYRHHTITSPKKQGAVRAAAGEECRYTIDVRLLGVNKSG